jgi:hypothetical protein
MVCQNSANSASFAFQGGLATREYRVAQRMLCK